MKMMFTLLLAAVVAPTLATQNPLSKALQLLDDLKAKVTAEGEAAAATHAEYQEACKDTGKELAFQIKTGNTQKDTLEASVEGCKSDAVSLNAKIENLIKSLSTAENDLKHATQIRDEEASHFAAEKSELEDVLDTLDRAIRILSRSLGKGGALLQAQNAASLAQAFAALEQASELSSADASKLTALVQNSQKNEDDDSDLSAPQAAAYESKSGSIVDTLENLREETQANLHTKQDEETKAQQNYEMLRQSLSDEIKYANKDMAAAKKSLSASNEKQSADEGALAKTNAELAADKTSLADLKAGCEKEASTFEQEVQDRANELEALGKAKEILTSSTGGAGDKVYAASFLQRSKVSSRGHDVLKVLRDLARKQNAPALAQLASRVASLVHSSSAEGDVFKKVKDLISDLISKLEEEAAKSATQKQWCDEQQAKSNEKKEDLSSTLEGLTSKIDSMQATSNQLKDEVKQLQKELTALAKAQAESDSLRQKQKADYDQDKADLDAGVEGVKAALQVLRDFYAGASGNKDAGGGIIGALEVVESDFTKDRASMVGVEEERAADHKQATKDNALNKAAKEQDVKYKLKESAGLDKDISELTQDQSSTKEELDAVLKYVAKLEEKCTPKAETYAEKKAARAAEIEGLKSALEILEAQDAFLQTTHSLRGVRFHQRA